MLTGQHTHAAHKTARLANLVGHGLVKGEEQLQTSSRRVMPCWRYLPIKGLGSSITLPVQRNSREREAVCLPVAIAGPAWRWGARDHIKAPLHIIMTVNVGMWLHSNHQPTNATVALCSACRQCC